MQMRKSSLRSNTVIKCNQTDNEYLKCKNNSYKISVSMFWIQEATLLVCAPPLEIVLILQ